MESQLVNRCAVRMHGVLWRYDRFQITCTLPDAGYADDMIYGSWLDCVTAVGGERRLMAKTSVGSRKSVVFL